MNHPSNFNFHTHTINYVETLLDFKVVFNMLSSSKVIFVFCCYFYAYFITSKCLFPSNNAIRAYFSVNFFQKKRGNLNPSGYLIFFLVKIVFVGGILNVSCRSGDKRTQMEKSKTLKYTSLLINIINITKD